MRALSAALVALSATAVAAESWPTGGVLSSLGLGGLWHSEDAPVPPPATVGEEAGDNWAVLVAGSNGWFNYRHQADISHAYQILRRNGFPEDKIITLMYDDIANDSRNPAQGKIINQPGGPDVYQGVVIDYRGPDVNPTVFMNVLIGQDPGVGSRKVLKSGPNDRVFINFADHGGVGLIAFPLGKIVTSKQLVDTLTQMNTRKMYKQLAFYMEACESGSMFEGLLPNNINIFATTASTASQSSYATYWDLERKTFLGDLYSVAWMEDSDCHFFGKCKGTPETLQVQFDHVYNRTKASSQPQEYGDLKLGKAAAIESFQAFHAPAQGRGPADERSFLTRVLSGMWGGKRSVRSADPTDVVDSRMVTIEALKRSLMAPSNAAADIDSIEAQLEAEYRGLQQAQDRFAYIAYTLAGANGKDYASVPVTKVYDHDCLSRALLAFVDDCHVMDDHHIRYSRVLAHLCNNNYSAEDIINAIRTSPACKVNQ